jgi:Protein of unknown function (DUF1091)
MKTLTPYYNSVINATLDLCEFVNGTQSNLATKYFIDVFTKSFPPGFIHPCPYFGEFKLNNISLNLVPQSMQFLTGTYKTNLRFYDDKDDNIITFMAITESKDVREKQ